MAKKTIYGLALLPDNRAVRVQKLDARKMLQLTAMVADMLPAVKAGELPEVSITGKSMVAQQEKTIAMCVKGITPGPVALVMKKRALTAEEAAAATKAGQPMPTEVTDGVDVEATLAPYGDRESEEFKRWIPLGELQLESDDENNDLSMWNLFEDPVAWKAVLNRIAAAGGGGRGLDPFAGKMLKTSAG
jgi:hypothetical protein